MQWNLGVFGTGNEYGKFKIKKYMHVYVLWFLKCYGF